MGLCIGVPAALGGRRDGKRNRPLLNRLIMDSPRLPHLRPLAHFLPRKAGRDLVHSAARTKPELQGWAGVTLMWVPLHGNLKEQIDHTKTKDGADQDAALGHSGNG